MNSLRYKSVFCVWVIFIGNILQGSVEEKMDQLDTWEFNIFTFSDEEIVNVVYEMFKRRKFFKTFDIDPKRFLEYLEVIKSNYLDNPYHNFHHAAEVTQFIYKMAHDNIFENKLSMDKRFALMLAALNHDIGHPGKSASYHKKLLTELYERFGDVSTLEKYHVEVAFSLMNDPAFEILKNVDGEALEVFISEMILATDMTFHDELLKKIKGGEITGDSKYGILAIKCADLGQLVRRKDISEKWVLSLHKEQYSKLN